MKKILFLTHMLPYPPISGGAIKRWKMVEYLSGKYNLSIVCFNQKKNNKIASEFKSKIRLSHYYSEEIKIERNFINLMNSYIKGIPLSVYRNYSPTMKEHIESITWDFDIIFLDSLLMFQYVPENYKGKIILHEHNAEYTIWKNYVNVENNYLKKIVIKFEAWRLMRYEHKSCLHSDYILASPNDKLDLEKINVDKNKIFNTWHLGDENLLESKNTEFDETEKSLMFAGSLSWQPNSDGLKWFIKNVWKLLIKNETKLKLYIIGKDADDELKNLANSEDNIFMTGFVEELEEYYSKSRLFIAPLRFGSGIKVKIINAMYRGVPVITTPVGIEGLDIINGKHASVTDDPLRMVDEIIQILNDKKLWKLLQDNSRKLMLEKYTWEKVFQNIDLVIEKL